MDGSEQPMIRFDHVRKVFPDGTVAVEDLSFDVAKGDVVTLVGPSGCGKTTTMKMVNRLFEPTGGTITVDGQDIMRTNVVQLRRRIGYVIQSVGLFPHQSVRTNVGTVPRLLGWRRDEIRERVDELLDLVELPAVDYRSRYALQLSGGERQRVGLARALAADPPVMLMDEPFGALDPITRARLQKELLRIQGEVRKTIVFVTHDIDEAILLGDRIAILREGGRLAQVDTPEEILAHPADDFVARFVGADRGLKRLSLTTLAEVELDPPNGAVMPSASTEMTLRDALSLMLSEGSRSLVVLDGDERPRGVLTLDRLSELLK
jgi:osmoprotectant transport system ATP-binding protein